MNNELLLTMVIIVTFLFMIAVIYAVIKSNLDSMKPENYFRIVKLKNGRYRVEEYYDSYNEWSHPRLLGPYIFNTLPEVEKRMTELIQHKKDEMEYSIDKIVD